MAHEPERLVGVGAALRVADALDRGHDALRRAGTREVVQSENLKPPGSRGSTSVSTLGLSRRARPHHRTCCAHQSDVVREGEHGDSGGAALHVEPTRELTDEVEHAVEVGLVDGARRVEHEDEVDRVPAL